MSPNLRIQLSLLPQYLTAHLQLVLVALAVGGCISLPLGVWAARRPRAGSACVAVASAVQTVPSLALLALMVPFLALLSEATAHIGFELPSIGYLPAVIALTLYSILPMLRNTVVGLRSVERALIEAALGVGMTDWQRLWRVELPQALPVLMAGVRTACTWVVGMAVLSTPVGAASLGNYIFTGLQTRNFTSVVVGCISSALLAGGLDFLMRFLERSLQRRSRWRLAAAGSSFLALFTIAGVMALSHCGDRRALKLGAKTFTEQYILAALLADQLSAETGQRPVLCQSLGSNVAFDALREGNIDLYVEYSGTLWATVLKRRDAPDRDSMLTAIDTFLAAQGLSRAASLGFANSYGLAVRRDVAASANLSRITDLARHAASWRIASDYEFFGRPEWQALKSAYGLAFAAELSMDPSLMYEAIGNRAVDAISAYSTDGRIDTLNLVMLDDDRHAIPPYDAMILVGPRVMRQPATMRALRALDNSIDSPTMRQLNSAVDARKRDPADVAHEFLARRRPNQ